MRDLRLNTGWFARRGWIIILLFLYAEKSLAQFSLGMSGGLNAPTAQIMEDGTFTFGGNYLPHQMMPSRIDYNTGNYFFTLAFFSFLEVNYRSILLRCEKVTPVSVSHTWNKDRSVGLKLRILPEGKSWRPALAIGSNDVVTTNSVTRVTSDEKGNRYFASIYGVLSKNIPIGDQRLLLSAGYYVPFYKHSKKKGPFGSAAWYPGCTKWLSVWAEYDCESVNLGLRACLFRHLQVQVFCYDFKNVSAGISYSINLLGRRNKCGY